MGVGEGLLDTLVKEVVWRHVGNVSGVGLADTAGKHADDVANDRPGIPEGGESAVLVTLGARRSP